MAVDEKTMWEYMESCNGEIRVMAARYGGGWLSAGCATVEWDFDEQWEDLVMGDNDYFAAGDFFRDKEGVVLVENAASAREAFDACVAKLRETID